MSSKDNSLRKKVGWLSPEKPHQDTGSTEIDVSATPQEGSGPAGIERRVSTNRPFSGPATNRTSERADVDQDVARLKALLDEEFERQAGDAVSDTPAGQETGKDAEPSARKGTARQWTGRIVKTLIGLAVIAIVGIMPAQRLLQPSSVEAVVNAPLVTIRAPIDGVVGGPANPLTVGQSVNTERTLLTISNPRVDTSRLTVMIDRLDRLRAEENSNQTRLAALEELRDVLRERVSVFAENRIAIIEARIETTEARLNSAVASVTKMVGRSQAADSSDLVALSGDPDAVIAAEYVRELRSELSALTVERDALAKGIFVGDSYNDRPQSAQRLDEVETQIVTLGAELEIARTQALWAQVAVSAERKRLAMQRETELRAPVAGEVWEVLAAPGENVIAGEPLLNIIDCSSPLVTAVVSEAVYNSLVRGTPAAFQFREGGDPVKGRVVLLSGMAAAPASYAITPAALTREAYRVTVALDDPQQGAAQGANRCAIGRTGRVVFGRDAV